jgi:hypothetical protein
VMSMANGAKSRMSVLRDLQLCNCHDDVSFSPFLLRRK